MKREKHQETGKREKGGESVAAQDPQVLVRSRRGTGRLIANVNVNVKSSGGSLRGEPGMEINGSYSRLRLGSKDPRRVYGRR